MKNATNRNNKEARIAILRNRLHAAETAWNQCRAAGRKAGAASREMSFALAELKSIA
jgi:hypothetical protein